jgi:hypothetical protein
MWAGAGDNSHLYLVTNKCVEPHTERSPSPLPSGYTIRNDVIRDLATSSPALESPASPAADSSYPLLAPSPVQFCDELFASQDGGRSWRSQGLLPGPLLGYGIKPLGPEALVMDAGTGPGKRAWVSVDSGAHWSEALRSDHPLTLSRPTVIWYSPTCSARSSRSIRCAARSDLWRISQT